MVALCYAAGAYYRGCRVRVRRLWLIAAGLDPARMNDYPNLADMTPAMWYFLPKGS
jgi:hypothetical protein